MLLVFVSGDWVRAIMWVCQLGNKINEKLTNLQDLSKTAFDTFGSCEGFMVFQFLFAERGGIETNINHFYFQSSNKIFHRVQSLLESCTPRVSPHLSLPFYSSSPSRLTLFSVSNVANPTTQLRFHLQLGGVIYFKTLWIMVRKILFNP